MIAQMKLNCCVSLLCLLFAVESVQAQYGEFEIVPDSEVIKVSYNFNFKSVSVFARAETYASQDKVLCMRIRETGETYFEDLAGRTYIQTNFVINGKCNDSSIIEFYIMDRWSGHLVYPVASFRLIDNKEPVLYLGKDACKVQCYPQHDPWMPTSYDPRIMDLNGYYINPDNGRVLKLKRAIASVAYTGCDMQDWIFIDPYTIYTNKQQVSYTGAELARKRKLRKKHWDLETFK